MPRSIRITSLLHCALLNPIVRCDSNDCVWRIQTVALPFHAIQESWTRMDIRTSITACAMLDLRLGDERHDSWLMRLGPAARVRARVGCIGFGLLNAIAGEMLAARWQVPAGWIALVRPGDGDLPGVVCQASRDGCFSPPFSRLQPLSFIRDRQAGSTTCVYASRRPSLRGRCGMGWHACVRVSRV